MILGKSPRLAHLQTHRLLPLNLRASPALAIAALLLVSCGERRGRDTARQDILAESDATTNRVSAPTVPEGESFQCTPTRVWDGDGPIWCAEGPRVRLAGIAAREMDGSCREGHPCPDATAESARDKLVELLGGSRGVANTGHVIVAAPPLNCTSEGKAGGTRTAAWCRTRAGVDLSCAMIKSGAALRWTKYDREDHCS